MILFWNFFFYRDLLNCLWNACTILSLTYKIVNYSSNSIKINLPFMFWKKLMQSCSKFQVDIKFQLNAARVSRLSFRFLWLWLTTYIIFLFFTTFWTDYALFILSFRRNKINCKCKLNFPRINFFLKSFMISFKWF